MRLRFIWLLIGWNETGAGRGLEKFCKINNEVTMLNDKKDFCCLDLKCSVMLLHRNLIEYV